MKKILISCLTIFTLCSSLFISSFAYSQDTNSVTTNTPSMDKVITPSSLYYSPYTSSPSLRSTFDKLEDYTIIDIYGEAWPNGYTWNGIELFFDFQPLYSEGDRLYLNCVLVEYRDIYSLPSSCKLLMSVDGMHSFEEIGDIQVLYMGTTNSAGFGRYVYWYNIVVDYVFDTDKQFTNDCVFLLDIEFSQSFGQNFREQFQFVNYGYISEYRLYPYGVSDPNIPSYDNPKEDYGGIIHDHNNKENEVLDQTEDGKEIFSNSLNWVDDAFDFAGDTFIAVGRCIDYIFSQCTWLILLVRFSLAVGLVAYVLNIANAIVGNVRGKSGKKKGGS